LQNSRINIHRLYKPLIQSALANWHEECLYLTLDTSTYWEEYCLVRLAVVYRGRALPVVWRVLKHSCASVAFNEYREMLYQSAHLLPKGVKVVLLADRGFIHIKAMAAEAMTWAETIASASRAIPGFGWPVQVGGN
jgi:hypothetical protein